MSDIDLLKIRCKQQDCKVATSGICLEGTPLNKCSYKYLIDETQIESQQYDEDDPIYQSSHSGELLKAEECGIITNTALTRLIILAGNVKSGKTTMLASLYQLLQDNTSFADYSFAGSLTLKGLEKRCFKSRLTSERTEPDMERTGLLEYDELAHLKLRKKSQSKVNLLFTDVSGEKFENLADSSEKCKKFNLAKRADHFVLFVDAFILSDLEKRQSTRTKSLNILRSLDESDMLNERTYIQIVFSRWDLLLKRENKEVHLAFLELFKNEIVNKFGAKYKRLDFFEIASSPGPDTELEYGYGIEKILPLWMEKSPYIADKIEEKNYSIYIKDNTRESIKYIYR